MLWPWLHEEKYCTHFLNLGLRRLQCDPLLSRVAVPKQMAASERSIPQAQVNASSVSGLCAYEITQEGLGTTPGPIEVAGMSGKGNP